MRKSLISLFFSVALGATSLSCLAQDSSISQTAQSPTAPGTTVSPAVSAFRESQSLHGTASFDERERTGMQLNSNLLFEVEITQGFSGDDATIGTPLRGRLMRDILVDGHIVARAGDYIDGSVTEIWHGKRTIKSYLPTKHFLNAQGRLFITFSQIVGQDKRRLAITGVLRPGTEVKRTVPSKLHLVVNKDGELTVKYSIAKYLTVDGRVSAGVLATGPVGMVAAPIITGTAGLLNPSYANGRPVDSSEKQSKLKNFAVGAGRGVPGASLIFGLSTKGLDIGLSEGDKAKVELKAQSIFKAQNQPSPDTKAASSSSI